MNFGRAASAQRRGAEHCSRVAVVRPVVRHAAPTDEDAGLLGFGADDADMLRATFASICAIDADDGVRQARHGPASVNTNRADSGVCGGPAKARQWGAFVSKAQLQAQDLLGVVALLDAFLAPPTRAAVSDKPFDWTWTRRCATGPDWRHHPCRTRVGLNPIESESARTTMRSTQQFSITLPNEMAEAVRAKVAAGEYATESEVIRDGLRVLLARDRAVEDWLRKDVAAAYDALKADPSRALGVGAVKARLAAAHKKASAKA